MKQIFLLAYRNIIKRPARSVAMMLLAGFLGMAIFCGTLIAQSLQNGFSSLEDRLGADIMVVPYEAATKSDLENIVLQGNTGYFYMDSAIYDEIKDLDGVNRCTAQYYLASANAGCCSASVEIIGYDPETDFAITPWIAKSTGEEPGYLDVVVGNDLNAFVGDTLTFYGTDVHVTAKLAKTGTSYDTAVFTGQDTIQTLIEDSLDKQLNKYANINAGNIVSCVLIDVAEDTDVEDVLNAINLHYKKVKAVRTTNLIAGVADSLNGISHVARMLVVFVWIVALLIMGVAFILLGNERRKEYAVLRVAGASRAKLAGLVLVEGIMVSAAGSLLGAVCGAVLILPFSGYIEQQLALPFLLPSAGALVLVGLLSVAAAMIAGAFASAVAAYRIARMDTGMILRAA